MHQVLIHIFPRPQRLSAMDQETSSGISHSVLALCKTKPALSAAAHFTSSLKDGLAFKGMSTLSAADRHTLCPELELPFPGSCEEM